MNFLIVFKGFLLFFEMNLVFFMFYSESCSLGSPHSSKYLSKVSFTSESSVFTSKFLILFSHVLPQSPIIKDKPRTICITRSLSVHKKQK